MLSSWTSRCLPRALLMLFDGASLGRSYGGLSATRHTVRKPTVLALPVIKPEKALCGVSRCAIMRVIATKAALRAGRFFFRYGDFPPMFAVLPCFSRNSLKFALLSRVACMLAKSGKAVLRYVAGAAGRL